MAAAVAVAGSDWVPQTGQGHHLGRIHRFATTDGSARTVGAAATVAGGTAEVAAVGVEDGREAVVVVAAVVVAAVGLGIAIGCWLVAPERVERIAEDGWAMEVLAVVVAGMCATESAAVGDGTWAVGVQTVAGFQSAGVAAVGWADDGAEVEGVRNGLVEVVELDYIAVRCGRPERVNAGWAILGVDSDAGAEDVASDADVAAEELVGIAATGTDCGCRIVTGES